MDCYTCRHNEQIDTLPPRELVAADEHWRTVHAFDSALPGWLVLVPRRHVTAIADLTDAEAAALGTWQVRLSRALRAVTGCVKTYVVQFAEHEGFAHVHFHLVPRMPDLPDDRRGPRVFGYLGAPEDQRVTEQRQDELATALRAELAHADTSTGPLSGRMRPANQPGASVGDEGLRGPVSAAG
ncbi:HIT family protein [Micromonospora zhanjiangensis]|uniref:HIT family protein n=1 Tax=Micromonospora zhanjiangensis TaxID=1522057 RepID=A0ABV8KXU5_9ACTN